MKKNSYTSLQKLLWCVLIAALPIVIALRSHHLNNLLEPGYGFYASRDWTVITLGAFLTVIGGLFTVLSFVNARKGSVVLQYNNGGVKSRTMAIISIALSVMLIWDAVVCAGFVSKELQNIAEDRITFTLLMKTGLLPCLMEAITAPLAALFAIIFGIDSWKGNGSVAKRRFLALFPVIWLVMRTIFRFTRTLSFMRVSELFYELMFLAFMLIFLITFAQLYSGINEGGNDWVLIAAGYPAAIIAIMCYVSRIITIALGNKLTTLVQPEFIEFVLALFILNVLRVRLKAKSKAGN